MDSVPMKEATMVASAYDEKLLATDPRFQHSVTIHHEEGTVLHFEWAFALTCGVWFFIFTEHHGFHVYARDDVEIIQRGERIGIEEIPSPGRKVPCR
jgi:hypothetical protein